MKLTTKARYAVAALVDVASNDCRGPVSLADVAQRTEVSQSYLEQLFCKLRRRGLVVSVRGPGGGYRLAQPAQATSVADIIEAVEEPVLDCDQAIVPRDPRTCCPTLLLWSALGQNIQGFLGSVTLADVLARRLPRAAGTAEPGRTVLDA